MPHETSPPRSHPRPEASRISAGAIVIGVALGLIHGWFFPLAMVAISESFNGGADFLVFLGIYFTVPVTAVVLAIFRRTRRWGTGMLIGLAVGSIVGAGACIASSS